ncbi:patatin-like phospholipase family protein [Shinella daejeonensis]|uniref:patatin-like phospholipase family protein n=1 Tax=Shinella daejeonensis TaxID=659017 RepID=UPI0020C7957F|nr:patatin-like phospholipase family protein [Shinella daejeonensis]MCP8897492.1 patatin-like phospholipase family protein [Shinella daejeonensis]
MTDLPRPLPHSNPAVALALGGGGARGLAHIPVIETLDEYGLQPQLVAGASIGALMGAALAAGMTGAEIRDHTLSVIGRKGEILNRLWSLRPASLSGVVAGGFRFGQFDLERILRVFLPESLPETFEELAIPLKVVASDYYGQCECLCESGPLFPALAASAALPAVFLPVAIGGRLMIDGGLWNPVPFDHIAGRAGITIGVDVIGAPLAGVTETPNGLDTLYGATQLTMRSIVTLKLERGAPDIFLQPDVGRFRVLDFLKAKEILVAAEAVRDDLRRALDARLAALG